MRMVLAKLGSIVCLDKLAFPEFRNNHDVDHTIFRRNMLTFTTRLYTHLSSVTGTVSIFVKTSFSNDRMALFLLFFPGKSGL